MQHIIKLLFSQIIFLLFTCKAPTPKTPPNTESPSLSFGDTVSAIGNESMLVYQDKNNNYWFGTISQGVYRYDGKHILRYTTKHGLVSNRIWAIQEDKSGNVYFDTQEGVSKYDGQSFTTLPVNDAATQEWKLEPDDLWFNGNWYENGVYRYDGKTLHQLELPENPLADQLKANFPNMTWSPYGIYTHYTDQQGNIWFGTSNVGLYRFDGKTVSWLYENHLTDTPNGGSFGIRSIFQDHTGKFWFCNTRYRYDISPGDSTANGMHLVPYTKEAGTGPINAANGQDLIYFMSITEDDNHNLWMLTYEEGVYRYDGKTVTHYPVKDGDIDVTLYSIFKDNRGDLWVGTHQVGPYKFNGKSFEKFKP
ncbi:MAG: hypothetical protein GC192_22415 [Bacteroidetes bacterium]|nr:hypothetical protein [Bacteroidota bacterium]